MRHGGQLAGAAARGRLRSTWREASAVAEREVIDDPHYTTPIYHKAEAAHIIAVPAQTFRNWAVGYARKRLDGSQVVSAPIVPTLEPVRPRGSAFPLSVLPRRTRESSSRNTGVSMSLS